MLKNYKKKEKEDLEFALIRRPPRSDGKNDNISTLELNFNGVCCNVEKS